MFIKRSLLLILIFLTLLCSLSAVSAENAGIADDLINDQILDLESQPSVSIEDIDD